MTKEEEEKQRWVIYYKASNTNSPGWNWKILKLQRRQGNKKVWRVFTWPSKQQALEAADSLYGRENCKIEPISETYPMPEHRMDK